GLVERDRKRGAQAQALPEDDAPAEVPDQLMVQQGRRAAVGPPEHQRLAAPVEHEPERWAPVTPEIQAIGDEPFTASLRGLEAIESEAVCLLCVNRSGEHDECAQGRTCRPAPRT